jgi:Flp pilus assembly protein TadG
MDRKKERGAAAVEFALVLPLLLALVFGIVEFGRLYNAQVVITNAARSAARTMAVTNDVTQATASATAAAPGITLQTPMNISQTTTAGACTANATLTTQMALLTGSWFSFGPTVTLTGVGAMSCKN